MNIILHKLQHREIGMIAVKACGMHCKSKGTEVTSENSTEQEADSTCHTQIQRYLQA